MNGVWLLARREFLGLLLSPLGWCALALTQLIIGIFFFIVFLWDFMSTQPMLKAAQSSFGITAYVVAPTFKSAALIMLLMTPLLSMRSFADERRLGTLSLLLSSPVSMRALVFGKFLGLLGFMLLIVVCITVMPLSLGLGGPLDLGLLAACVLALSLLAATFSAAGVFVSSLCRQPATAALGTLILLIALWALDTSARAPDSASYPMVEYLSLTRHLDALMRGVFSSADVVYFVLLTVALLGLTVHRLDGLRTAE